MNKVIIFGLIGLLISLDQFFPRLADWQIRSSSAFEFAQSKLIPNLEELPHRRAKVCDFATTYAIYHYQVCFRPYISGSVKYPDGYHLVYHKPKPKLSLIMPANGPENYYFKEMAQGEFIIFVRRDGTIQYGDGR